MSLGSLRADLRGSAVDAGIALVLSAALVGVYAARVHGGVDAAAIEMPDMVRNGGVWPYSASQALGWAALLWSWLTIHLGLALPICRRLRRRRLRARLEALHRSMSLTVIGLMLAHALLLLWDQMGDTLVSDFVPYATSYAPGRFPQALGIFSFYLAVLLGPSFYLRSRLGPVLWRVLHQWLVPSVYVLALWHTLSYGSDVKHEAGLTAALWAMQVPLAATLAWRLSGVKPLARGPS